MNKKFYIIPAVSELGIYPGNPLAASGGAGSGKLFDFDDQPSYGGGAGSVELEPFG